MKLLLTSFGLTQHRRGVSFRSSGEDSMFYRMPPVAMRQATNRFMPDYGALLLCDKVILDTATFRALERQPHGPYGLVADTLLALKAEGLVELVDYSEVLSGNQDLLDRMLKQDLATVDRWIKPLKESMEIWTRFTTAERLQLHEHYSDMRIHQMAAMESLYGQHRLTQKTENAIWEALGSAKKRREAYYRSALKGVLEVYLSYVNANLLLSSELGMGFHDWLDFLPFYRQKFLSVGRRSLPNEQSVSAVEALFEVSFPEFAIKDTQTFLKVLRDSRLEDLRSLVQKAANGEVAFDQAFARQTLQDILKIEQRVARYRRLIFYLALPLHMVPWAGIAAHKAAEEIVGSVVERRLSRSHRWYYLLSDVSRQTQTES